jgi:thiol-disulfide isomerase/thioredoxin
MEERFDFASPRYRVALPRAFRKLLVKVPVWETDYGAALAVAQQTQRIVFLLFTGNPWCGHCVDLHQEVLDSALFWSWASKKVVLLQAYIPPQNQWSEIPAQSQKLVSTYGLNGLPDALGLNPDGSLRGRLNGYSQGLGPHKWLMLFEFKTGLNQTPVP